MSRIFSLSFLSQIGSRRHVTSGSENLADCICPRIQTTHTLMKINVAWCLAIVMLSATFPKRNTSKLEPLAAFDSRIPDNGGNYYECDGSTNPRGTCTFSATGRTRLCFATAVEPSLGWELISLARLTQEASAGRGGFGGPRMKRLQLCPWGNC
jgi:hypothetical protein